VPPATHLPVPSPKRWHVSAPVDLLGYAFGWAIVWIPLLFLPESNPQYIWIYLLVIAATDVHRHYGLPYVYMDREIRSQYPLRFFFLPVVLFAAWAASPWLVYDTVHVSGTAFAALIGWIFVLVQVLRRDGGEHPVGFNPLVRGLIVTMLPAAMLTAGTPRGFDSGWWWLAAALAASVALEKPVWRTKTIPFFAPGLIVVLAILAASLRGLPGFGNIWMGHFINGVAVFAGAWNFYHVYMQKYGILRLYNAKSGQEEKVPGWVDKLMVFAWLPVYFVWIGPLYKAVILVKFHQAGNFLPPLIEIMDSIKVWAVPLFLIVPLSVAILIWIVTEYRVNRLKNWPRLAMFVGTNLLAMTFLVADPVKAYLAFAFSHAIEYMIFVWAYQRRRYSRPLSHKPLLQRVLRHPMAAYLIFILGLSALFLYLKFWGSPKLFSGADQPMAFGYRTAVWLLYWGIYQSMVHFYFDGFLWKMRKPTVRANI